MLLLLDVLLGVGAYLGGRARADMPLDTFPVFAVQLDCLLKSLLLLSRPAALRHSTTRIDEHLLGGAVLVIKLLGARVVLGLAGGPALGKPRASAGRSPPIRPSSFVLLSLSRGC